MIIRLAMEKDIPDMIRLLLQVGKVHNVIRPDIFREQPCKYSEADLAELLKDKERPIFIYEDDEGCVQGYAFCIVEVTKDNPVLKDSKELYIDDLCVDQDHRGAHVGSAIYDYVLAYARENGFDTITLNVWEGNDSARSFYEKKGMKPRKTYMEYHL